MAEETTPIVQHDPAAAFQKLLEKQNGNGVALASQLFDENYQLRVKNRDLTEKLPKDGTVSLTVDDAKRFEAFKALGAEPDAIKASLDKLPELEKQTKELSQMETYREVAAIGGYKVPVLKKLMTEHPDAVFEIRDQKDKDGKDAKVAFIRNGDKELPFAEFAKANFADFLPALQESSEQLPRQNGNTPDPPAHNLSRDEKVQKEMIAQAATGRYSL